MEFDSTSSPFMRLPSPHQNLILTPPTLDDEADVLIAMNDPSVYMNLLSPPLPFTKQDFLTRQKERIEKCNQALEAFLLMEKCRREGGTEGIWVGDMPLGTIREVDGVTGKRRFVGEFSLRRRRFGMMERKEGARLKGFNDGLEVGDRRIGWDIGCEYFCFSSCFPRLRYKVIELKNSIVYLSPKFQGKGIMAVVLRTLRDEFMVPYMNVWDFQGSYLEHNQASRRVFEKCGFVFDRLVKDVVELSEAKTGVKGKMCGMGYMTWTREKTEIEN